MLHTKRRKGYQVGKQEETCPKRRAQTRASSPPVNDESLEVPTVPTIDPMAKSSKSISKKNIKTITKQESMAHRTKPTSNRQGSVPPQLVTKDPISTKPRSTVELLQGLNKHPEYSIRYVPPYKACCHQAHFNHCPTHPHAAPEISRKVPITRVARRKRFKAQ